MICSVKMHLQQKIFHKPEDSGPKVFWMQVRQTRQQKGTKHFPLKLQTSWLCVEMQDQSIYKSCDMTHV